MIGVLSAGQRTKLRASSYNAVQYISLNPNATVYAARLDTWVADASIAEFEYTAGAGTLADVWVGMTILISHTNSKPAAYWRGRVRKAPDADTFFINETSDTGDWTNGDYVFVINDIDLWEKLPREDSGTRYNDWDLSFRQLPPVVYNLKESYADFISGTPAGYTIQFQPAAFAATDGASVSAYQFTLQTGAGTVTAGALNTNNVTIRFNEGFWITRLVVTDSGGRTATRYIPVHAHGSTYTPELGFTGAAISASAGVWTATIDGFEGIDDILDNTHATIWSVEYYGGIEGEVVDNVNFVGRLRTEDTQVQALFQAVIAPQTAFQLESVSARLARINAPLITMQYDTTPTGWDQIDKLNIWRAVVYALAEFSTFFHCCSLDFADKTDTYLALALDLDPVSLWEALRSLLSATNSVLEQDGQGRFYAPRNGNYLSAAGRAALNTVIDLELRDFMAIGRLSHGHAFTTGLVYADGGVLQTAGLSVDAYTSIAPGQARGQGDGMAQLGGQILTADATAANAQAELNQRCGFHFAAANPTDTMDVSLPDGYHCLTPSLGEWYTWTLSTTETGRQAYTSASKWNLTDLTQQHSNDTGGREVSARFVLSTTGSPGQVYQTPEIGEIAFEFCDLPGYSQFPVLADVVLPDCVLLGNPKDVSPGGSTETLVTFEATGSYPYAILSGTVASSGGNPGRCLVGQVGNSAKIRVTMPSVVTVTSVSMDVYSEKNTVTYSVKLYDSGLNLLSTPISATLTGITAYTWTHKSASANMPGVYYIEYEVDTDSVIYDPKLDNAEAEYAT